MSYKKHLVNARSKRINKETTLVDAMIKKMEQLDKKRLQKAIEMKDALFIAGLAGDALTALKVREKTNKNDGVLVEAIQRVGGGKKGQAWCMYAMMTCLAISELLTGVVSPIVNSGGVAYVRNDTKKKHPSRMIPLKEALYGDILGYVNKNGTGHTEMFKHWVKKYSVTGTNGSNTTSGKIGDKVVREGGGSYYCERKASVWDFCIRPFPVVQADVVIKEPNKASEIPKFGDVSDRVASLQKALNANGAKLKVDGEFGPLTKAAVSKFQKEKGLRGSGIIGVVTMRYLGL